MYGFVGNNPIDLLDSNGLVPREITRTDYARNSLYVNGKRYVGYTSLEAYYIYQYTEAAGKCCCNAIATKWRIFSIVEHPQIFPVLSPANFMDEFRKINNMLYSEEDFDKTADYPFADIEGTKIHERQHVAQYIAEEAEISEKMQAPISHCKNLQSNECQVIREMCTSLSQQQSGWSELKEQHLADIDRWMNNRYPGALRERDSLTEEWKYYARKYGNRRINN